MKFIDQMPLQLKARVILLASNFGAILFISIAFIAYEVNHLREGGIRELQALVNNLEVTLRGPLLFLDEEEAEKTIATLSSIQTIESAHVYNNDFHLFSSYWRPDIPHVVPVLREPGVHTVDGRIILVDDLRVENQLYGYISITSDMGHVHESISKSITIIVSLSLIWLLFSFFLAKRLQKAVAGPVTDLSKWIDSVTRNEDYSKRIDVHREDEVGQLSKAFDKLLEGVQARDLRLAEQLQVSLNAELAAQQSSFNLQLEKQFTDNLIAHLPALYLLLDSRLSCRKINDYALTILNINDPSFLESGSSVLEFIPKRSREEFDILLRDTMESGSMDFEIDLSEKHSDARIFLFHAVTISIDDEQLIQAVGFDITERYKLEQDLRQAQKMEVVGQLAGGVAHDFNNILHAITGFVEAAKVAKGSPRQDAFLNEALASAERAAGVTKQLLAFGRKQALRQEPLSINDLLKSLTAMLQRLIGVHISLIFNEHPKDPYIFADQTQIEQVLMNLCVNARDAMPDGGSISVNIECLDLTADDCEQHPHANPGTHVCIHLKDTGHGMDRATLERVFEPFFTTKGVGQGTGLGLAVVYGIIRQHSGIIEVESKPGQGTAFRIYLPLAKSTISESGTLITPSLSKGNETILFAEDEPGIRSVITLFLENAGYRVLLATNGQEAVETFNNNSDTIDLLLFDSNMPKLGGTEAYEMIANIKPGLPVIFSTGNAERHTDDFAERSPMISLICKPYRPAQLLKHIRQVFADIA